MENIKKAIGTIETEIGTMTIYYNGAGNQITAERGNIVEEKEYTPENYDDAVDAAYAMYKYNWNFEFVKRYQIKPEFYDAWTDNPNYKTASIVDADEIERLSREWGTPIDELMKQVYEI